MDHEGVRVHRMHEHDEVRDNLCYWLSRPPEERLAAVDELRRQFYGDPQPIKRTVRVVRMTEDSGHVKPVDE